MGKKNYTMVQYGPMETWDGHIYEVPGQIREITGVAHVAGKRFPALTGLCILDVRGQYMEYSKLIEWDIQDSIGIMSIANLPQNKIEEPQFVELEVLERWIQSPLLKGIVIMGKGRHFSSGANTERLFGELLGQESLAGRLQKGREILDLIENLTIPVVAAIRGACFGAGFEIALACHFLVCAESALFAFPEVMHGILPGLGGTVRLTRRVGTGRSLELILSGRIVNGVDALDMGIADYVVPAKEILSTAVRLILKG